MTGEEVNMLRPGKDWGIEEEQELVNTVVRQIVQRIETLKERGIDAIPGKVYNRVKNTMLSILN